MKKVLLGLAAAVFLIASCKRPEIPSFHFENDEEETSGEEEEEKVVYSNIEGTAINPTNNAVGWVYDKDTNRGIPGVYVTDGYSFTTTDENGVYQFFANRYTRNIYLTVPAE